MKKILGALILVILISCGKMLNTYMVPVETKTVIKKIDIDTTQYETIELVTDTIKK